MAVNRLVRDVEAATWQAIKEAPRLRPGECLGALLVIGKIGADAILWTLTDSLPGHGEPFVLAFNNGRAIHRCIDACQIGD
jgi:hypothetical protein